MSTPPPVLGYAPPERNNLLEIAKAQKWIIYLILARIGLFVLQMVVAGQLAAADVGLAFAGIGWVMAIVSIFFAIRLGRLVYKPALGITFGILTVLPLVGVLFLLIINSKATRTLVAAGIKVGLLGARMSQVPTTVVR